MARLRSQSVSGQNSFSYVKKKKILVLFLQGLSNLSTYKTAAAAAKSLQSCPTLCDPIDNSPPGSPVPGILRQEHRSGLPFPSPMRESEVAQSCLTLLWPHGL